MKASTPLRTSERSTSDCLPLLLQLARPVRSRVFPAAISTRLAARAHVNNRFQDSNQLPCESRRNFDNRLAARARNQSAYVPHASVLHPTPKVVFKSVKKIVFPPEPFRATLGTPSNFPLHTTQADVGFPHPTASIRTRLVQIRRNPFHDHGSRPTRLHRKSCTASTLGGPHNL